MVPPRYPQKVALVTGSTSGIGYAIALRLVADGYSVVFHSRSSVKEGQALAEKHTNAIYLQADLSVEQQSRDLIAAVLVHFGRLDVLINNAGHSQIIAHSDLKAASPEVWREQFELNVIAPWVLITEAEEALKNNGSGEPSVIVNISTHASVRPKGASIPYASAKAALNHMTKLLALNFGPNIRVNAIAPGLVETPLSKDWDAARKLWNEKSPMRREAQPDEIAQLVSMVVANNYLTGEVILADGGLNLT